MADGIAGKGGTVVAVLWAEILLIICIVGLRLYTRKSVRGAIGSDDWCLIATSVGFPGRVPLPFWQVFLHDFYEQLFLIIFATFVTVSATHGMGQHAADLTTAQFSRAVLFLLCGQFAASLAIGMGKTTVAVFLLRIITSTWQRWFLLFCIGSMMLLSIVLCVALFTQCTPVEAIWNSELLAQRVCHINLTAVAFADCAYAAVLDFSLAAFPWIALRNLNMKRKERITICMSLSLGVFAGICGVIRTSGLKALSNSADYLYATSDSVIWTFSEVSTTIVCVSLPALRPLFNRLIGKTQSSNEYQQQKDEGAGTSDTYNLKSYPKSDADFGYIGHRKNHVTTNTECAGAETRRDNGSDESILLAAAGSSTTKDSTGIMRMQEIDVTYERATSENNDPVSHEV